ncbi:MAG: calcium/sodium antiporter [Candidatus Binatia bacterium]
MDGYVLLRFVVGLVLLVAGAEALVRGASRLAALFGISRLVIGLTIVAAGTSSPELAVSVGAALTGQSDIAVGNVVGSNIFNVLFILGLCALVAPLRVSSQLVRTDVPVMIGTSLLLLALGADGRLSPIDGLFLLAGMVAYFWYSVAEGRREQAAAGDGGEPTGGLVPQLLWVAAGLALLVLGARWLVEGAVAMARLMGVSELVVGLTIVAAGTSLPEVATSVVASVRGQRDIAVGNVVGSNIFNILGILGASALVAGGLPVAPSLQGFDIPVMVAVALACLPIFFTGHVINRSEGALFLGYYVGYTLYVILAAARHDALAPFSGAMMTFVVPLTIVTLVIVAVRAARSPTAAG